MASQLPVEEDRKESSMNRSPANGQEAATPAEESTPGGDQVMQKKRGGKRRREEKEGQGEEDKKRRASPMASSLGRPSRERKSVERYAALSPRKMSATKVLSINQGSGEKLKDIPNVAFKLSRRKADESIRVLHRILFGRKGNVHFLKRNILQFSGFVWSQNEEKDRLKVKEKLNKCNKDRLLDLSNLLDIYTLKVNTKKEDISVKLLEFLESPHVTREVILSEKDKKPKKNRRGANGAVERALEEASPDKGKTREERDLKGEDKEGCREPAKADKEDKDKGGSIDRDESADEDKSADAEETSEHCRSKEEDEENEQEPELTKRLSDGEGMDEHEELDFKQDSPAVRKVSHATSKKSLSYSKKKDMKSESKVPSDVKAGFSKDGKSSKTSATSKKGLSSSKKKVDKEDEPNVPSESKTRFSKDTKGSSKMKKDKLPVKMDSEDNSKRKVSMKGESDSGPASSNRSKKVDNKKGKSTVETASKDMKVSKKQDATIESNNAGKKKGKKKDVVVVPSTEQLSAVLNEILKEVDFNVATLADIIKQLGAHFDTDLMHRKTEIKRILEEVINNMTDDEYAEDDDGGAEVGEKN